MHAPRPTHTPYSHTLTRGWLLHGGSWRVGVFLALWDPARPGYRFGQEAAQKGGRCFLALGGDTWTSLALPFVHFLWQLHDHMREPVSPRSSSCITAPPLPGPVPSAEGSNPWQRLEEPQCEEGSDHSPGRGGGR